MDILAICFIFKDWHDLARVHHIFGSYHSKNDQDTVVNRINSIIEDKRAKEQAIVAIFTTMETFRTNAKTFVKEMVRKRGKKNKGKTWKSSPLLCF